MGFQDIYLVELLGSLNGVTCRNTYHFKSTFPATNAQWLAEYFQGNFFNYMKGIFAMDYVFTAIRVELVSQAYLDSYQILLNEDVGEHPANSVDPRLCVKWTLWGDHAFGPNSKGRNFYSGIPYDWAQTPPRFADFGQDAHKIVAGNLLAFYGKNGANPYLHWGVFSKRNFKDTPTVEVNWWFPITRIYINPLISSLRTRRLRGPF